MDQLLYLLYTHREYDDILQIHLKRLHEFFPEIPIAVCSNDIEFIKEKYGSVYKFHSFYEYPDKAPFGERVRCVVERIPNKYVLFNLDLNILTKPVDVSIIQELMKLIEQQDIDQVRLFITGIVNPIFDSKLVHRITDGYYFSCNSAIWRTAVLHQITHHFCDVSFRLFESQEIQKYVSYFNNYYTSNIQDFQIPKEGHFFSHHFPVIHITNGGRWRNNPFHETYIQEYAKEFTIDLQKRGVWF
jgi:hypothetical protein